MGAVDKELPQAENHLAFIQQGSHIFSVYRGNTSAPAAVRSLDSTKQRQNHHDYQNGTNQSARTVTPARTVGPTRQRTNEYQDQDNNQDRREHRAVLRNKISPSINAVIAQMFPMRGIIRLSIEQQGFFTAATAFAALQQPTTRMFAAAKATRRNGHSADTHQGALVRSRS
jgi:hypothetical protein